MDHKLLGLFGVLLGLAMLLKASRWYTGCLTGTISNKEQVVLGIEFVAMTVCAYVVITALYPTLR